MFTVMCDLLADINIHIPCFPIQAGSVHRLVYLDLGPGGAANIAIMASRLDIPVTYLGEIGADIFGDVVLDGLEKEGVATNAIMIRQGASTPIATVVVDHNAEPAYLGIARDLDLDYLPEEWLPVISQSRAIFADGWAEHSGVPKTVIAGFQAARSSGVKVFFDPGPGNPDVSEDWVQTAIDITDILLVNDLEAIHYSGEQDPDQAAWQLLRRGPEMVVLKLGPGGNTIYTPDQVHHTPGFKVKAVDQTGAGDSTTGAVVFGWLNGISVQDMGILANAAGAAKVQKRGTGRNLPTPDEIRRLLLENGFDPGILP